MNHFKSVIECYIISLKPNTKVAGESSQNSKQQSAKKPGLSKIQVQSELRDFSQAFIVNSLFI